MSFRALPFALLLLAGAAPAAAELPPPVRAMIDAAIATGDEGKVRTVVELAKATNPGDVAEIDAIDAAFFAKQAEQKRLAEEHRLEAIREAGVFQRWKGRGEIGGSRATGNSPSLGLAAGLDIKRDGIDWSHHLTGRADYQRTNGVVTREKYFAAYEPRYQIGADLFAYGLGQFERDTIQGYDATLCGLGRPGVPSAQAAGSESFGQGRTRSCVARCRRTA